MYRRILYKIHVFRFMSQYLSSLRILCKIHVDISGFMTQHLYISGSSANSMAPDPYLRFMSQYPYFRNLCKIHISGSVSQDPLQDPCLRFMSQHLYTSGSLQDPCLRIHVSASWNLRLLYKIHVSGSVYKHPYVSQDPLLNPCVRFIT